MEHNWTKYVIAIITLCLLVSFLYYLSVQTTDSDKSATGGDFSIKKLTDTIPEFDFYRLLPEGEEVVSSNLAGVKKDLLNLDTLQDKNIAGLSFQVGAYQSMREANKKRAELILNNLPAKIETATVNGTTWYRVRISPDSLESFNRIKEKLDEQKLEYFLTRPKS